MQTLVQTFQNIVTLPQRPLVHVRPSDVSGHPAPTATTRHPDSNR